MTSGAPTAQERASGCHRYGSFIKVASLAELLSTPTQRECHVRHSLKPMLFYSAALSLVCLLFLLCFYRLKLRVLRRKQGKIRSEPYRMLRGGRTRERLMRSLDRSRMAHVLARTEKERLEKQLDFLTRFSARGYYWQVRQWHSARSQRHPRAHPAHSSASRATLHPSIIPTCGMLPFCQFVIWARDLGLMAAAFIPVLFEPEMALQRMEFGSGSQPALIVPVVLALAILAASLLATIRVRPNHFDLYTRAS